VGARLDDVPGRREQHGVWRVRRAGRGSVSGRKQGEYGVHVVFGKVLVATDQCDEFIDDALHPIDRFCIAPEQDFVAARSDLRVWKGVFDLTQENVVKAEEEKRVDLVDVDPFLGQRDGKLVSQIAE